MLRERNRHTRQFVKAFGCGQRRTLTMHACTRSILFCVAAMLTCLLDYRRDRRWDVIVRQKLCMLWKRDWTPPLQASASRRRRGTPHHRSPASCPTMKSGRKMWDIWAILRTAVPHLKSSSYRGWEDTWPRQCFGGALSHGRVESP